MSTSFASSFWSTDYAGGLGVLFGKLQQGVQENEQVLTIARMRAEAEDMYSQRLGDINPACDKIPGGFQKDEGATVRKAYDGVRAEMQAAADAHRKISSNIRELVVQPFSRWCEAHAARIQNSQDDLQARMKAHDRQAEQVRKFRSQYYNKCRLVEDLEEEDKMAFQDSTTTQPASPKAERIPSLKVSEPEDVPDDEPIELGDHVYSPEQLKRILTQMLNTIRLGEVKVPILGTYQNVSTGSEITEHLQSNLGASTVSYAERIGQDLIQNGFLRLIGNMGSTFANSSRMNYQWRPKAFKLTGLPEKRKTQMPQAGQMERTMSISSVDSAGTDWAAVGDYVAGWNPLNNAHPNETPPQKLRREARESDERYKASVRKLDGLRCDLEQKMIEHFKFMEQCELDRLKAIKSVVLDFSGAIGNVIPSLQSTVDNMMLFQETVQPLGDLRYLLENYRTGQYAPKVPVYENYYNSVDEQTFGVDIEARARADRKRVPIIITTILTFLDNHYPDLEGDEARRGIWLVDVPLAATHHLRNVINTGKPIEYDVLDKYEVPIVASVLKLYLLELPDSLVSSHVYEIVKTIYTQTAPSTDETTRISVIQSTLGQLRLANIATLDAIMTHFTRLIDLTSADDTYVASLANNLAPCILRPRAENSLTMDERYSYRLIRDLFAHKDEIFNELKRASTLAHAGSTGGSGSRTRAQTDESNRKAHMEERQRAIASRSRATSPAPGFRTSMHRRDKSTDGAATRFPINTSPSEARKAPLGRNSLEVPGNIAPSTTKSEETPTTGANAAPTARANGVPNNEDLDVAAAAAAFPPGETFLESPEGSESANTSAIPKPAPAPAGGEIEKRNSLGRSHAASIGAGSSRFPRRGTASSLQRSSLVGSQRDSNASLGEQSGLPGDDPNRPHGIQLSDRPMDD